MGGAKRYPSLRRGTLWLCKNADANHLTLVSDAMGFTRVQPILRAYPASVRLMDSSNFSSYGRGGQMRYLGGNAVHSPVRLTVSQAGHWHVAIDLGGRSGAIRAGVRVIS
jgi:hypothetical protein